MVIYFVLGGTTKFFSMSPSMSLSNVNNNPVLKPCKKKPARQ